MEDILIEEPINVTQSSMPDYDEYCAEIKDLWGSRWLTNMGVKHKQLEKELKDYLNTPNIILCTNGHLALENIIEGLNLSGEIITTPFTFASTTHAIVRCGCTPVFCDINEDDYTMDVTKIESLITEKTSAILPVHVYGNMCDVEAIDRIAKKYNLKVIYDAAHTFGVKYKGISSANFGDAAMFSFHATKVYHTIEGGAICFQDESLTQIYNDIKNFGIRDNETVKFVGGNAKMNEFQAAMGICNLRHIDEEINKRKGIVEHYIQRLSNVDGIKIYKLKSDVEANYSYFPVVFENYKYNRDEICEMLEKKGIIARKYFYPLTNNFECYKGLEGYDESSTPVAKKIANEILTLPLYADLSLEIVDYICDIILEQ